MPFHSILISEIVLRWQLEIIIVAVSHSVIIVRKLTHESAARNGEREKERKKM